VAGAVEEIQPLRAFSTSQQPPARSSPIIKVSDEQWLAQQAESPARPGELPPHLAGYAYENGMIIAVSSAVPEVYTFPPGPPPQGLSLRATPDGPPLEYSRAVIDTGANLVLASKQWVLDRKLPWQATGAVSLHTSSGATFCTAGRLSQPLILVLCAGTPAELRVAVDVHIMDEAQDVFQLLLGTPVINALGGDLSSYHSSFVYRPFMRVPGGDSEVLQSIPICTYTMRSSPQYSESARFMLGAVSAWALAASG
jgi:hypothetical protein